jgi:serine/threonine-protein kinase
MVRGLLPALMTLALAVGGRLAHAQPNPQQAALAEALVERGKEQMEQGKLEEACRSFEEADRVSDSWATGALAKLAECHEKAGRLASAWGTWVKAELAASRAGKKDRADYAKGRAADLDPRVPKLTIVVPEGLSALPGVEVLRDGVQLPRTEWGLPIRVDAGRRTIRIAAPSRVAWEVTIELRSGDAQILAPASLGDSARVIDAPSSIAEDPGAPPGAGGVAASPDGAPGRVQRTVGLTVGIAGLAGLAVAGGLGVATLTKGADASFVCGPKLCATQAEPGAVLANDARKLQSGAIVTAVFGGAAVASGAVVYLMAPRARSGPRVGAPPARGVAVVVRVGGASLSVPW